MTVLLTNDFGEDGFSTSLVLQQAEALLGLAGKEGYELSLLLTTDSAIQEINAAWRHKNKPTNVLSFPMDDDEDSLQPMLGDIIISIDTAKRESLAKQYPLQTYLSRLLVHGFVHLLGYDHETSAEAYDEMLAVEQYFLQKLNSDVHE
ncbi:MAG: rRNA maturation RNase YbeY [Desulfobulbaceae bacterium]|jgi:probable rRNA maturation factor|nr:rRNA maturation RNase YbeY [Desulfobulbaceae bacterium]